MLSETALGDKGFGWAMNNKLGSRSLEACDLDVASGCRRKLNIKHEVIPSAVSSAWKAKARFIEVFFCEAYEYRWYIEIKDWLEAIS